MKTRYKLSTTAMRVQPAEMTRARSWKSRGPTILTSDTAATLASLSGHIQPVIAPCAGVLSPSGRSKPLGESRRVWREKTYCPSLRASNYTLDSAWWRLRHQVLVYRVFLLVKPTGGNSRPDSQQRGARAIRIVAGSDRFFSSAAHSSSRMVDPPSRSRVEILVSLDCDGEGSAISNRRLSAKFPPSLSFSMRRPSPGRNSAETLGLV